MRLSRSILAGGLAVAFAGGLAGAAPDQQRPCVRWAASWDAAVAEATARHVPIFVTFHKDG
jgi:hypothetical protein